MPVIIHAILRLGARKRVNEQIILIDTMDQRDHDRDGFIEGFATTQGNLGWDRWQSTSARLCLRRYERL